METVKLNKVLDENTGAGIVLWYLGVVSVSKGEGPWYRFIQDRDLYLSPQNTVAIVTMLIITLEMFITSMKYVSK